MQILTIDIEDWFHILDHDQTRYIEQWKTFESRVNRDTDLILSLLEQHQQKATFFILGWIGEQHPQLIKKIHQAGHPIGLHSYEHQLISDQSKEQFQEDIHRAKTILEDIIGAPIHQYRAPGFSIRNTTKWAWEILLKENITTDASVFPAHRLHGGYFSFPTYRPCRISIDGVEIKEFPVNTTNLFSRKLIFSGGGYFRATPYPIIQRLTKNSDYVMAYFHPRDFDTQQPIVPGLPAHRKFLSYYGINGLQEKFEKWLREFHFMDLTTAENQTDWDKTPIYDLNELR